MKMDPCLIPLTKVNSKWIKDLNIRPNTIKFLGKHRKSSLMFAMALILGTSKAQTKTKINKWDDIKPRSFCTAKETYRMGEEICKLFIGLGVNI